MRFLKHRLSTERSASKYGSSKERYTANVIFLLTLVLPARTRSKAAARSLIAMKEVVIVAAAEAVVVIRDAVAIPVAEAAAATAEVEEETVN
jgi:hypothetical protein